MRAQPFDSVRSIREYMDLMLSSDEVVPTQRLADLRCAVLQLLEFSNSQRSLLLHAERFVRDYHRSLVKQHGDVSTGKVDEDQHPLIAPFVADMAEWMQQRDAILTGMLLGQHQKPKVHAPVLVEGDDIPGVRCATCEE